MADTVRSGSGKRSAGGRTEPDHILDFGPSGRRDRGEGKERFRILMLSDLQIIDLGCTRNPTRDRQIKGAYFREGVPGMEERCFTFVRETVARAAPDLLVFAGDNVYGEFDDLGRMQDLFCREAEGFGIPWAPIFGNHDNESRMGVRWQMSRFAECPHCLFTDGGLTGHGNYSLSIRRDGRDVMLLFLLDTNGCRTVGDPWAPEEGITPDNIDYGLVCHEAGIYPDQTAWYRAVAQTAKERNGRTVPSLAFFHIPLTVYDEVFRECYGYEFGVSFDATRPGDYGGIYEHSKHTVDADGSFYRTARECGTAGFFTAHEHRNDACIHRDGAVFAYGVKSGYCTFYRRGAVGGTVIDVFADGSFTVFPLYTERYFI